MYQVVEARSIESLEAEVNRLLKEGWRPQGGVSVTPAKEGESYPWFRQAMVKD